MKKSITFLFISLIVSSLFCQHVKLPSNIESVGIGAFEGTKNLKVNNKDCAFISTNGKLINYNGDDYIVTIPKGITRIGAEAFSNNTYIYEVIIPEGVTEIGDSAFRNCSNLEKITFPRSLKKIGNGAFAKCTKLRDLKLPKEPETNREGIIEYKDFVSLPLDEKVRVEAYVQAKQSWWEDKATLYTQNKDGAYYIYNAACTKEAYDKLVPGTKIIVTGYKAEWAGEIEIVDGTFEIFYGDYIADPYDVTNLLGTDELIKYQNQFVEFKGMTVEDAGDGKAFLYKWNGSGADGDDLYFNVSKNGKTYTFTVESYLCDKDSDVYKDVKNLEIGDVIDMEGFLYWYEGLNPHITRIKYY